MDSLFAGVCAGLAVDVLLYPLDTLKTRIQAAPLSDRVVSRANPFNGVGALFVGSFPSSAIFFLVFDQLREYGCPTVASAILAECSAASVRIPVEVIKQQLQVQQRAGHALQHVLCAIKKDGITGLYRGALAMLLRDLPFSAIQYPLFVALCQKIQEHGAFGGSPWTAAVAGGMAGGMAGALTNPLDVCKTQSMVYGRINWKLFMSGNAVSTAVLFAGIRQRTTALSVGGFLYFGAYSLAKRLT